MEDIRLLDCVAAVVVFVLTQLGMTAALFAIAAKIFDFTINGKLIICAVAVVDLATFIVNRAIKGFNKFLEGRIEE